jgi:HEPN domain-containing protein
MKNETRQWCAYAEDNYQSACLLRKERLYIPCLQNTQQAIEKWLKAVLIERGKLPQKTHSIAGLIQALKEEGAAIPLSEDETDLLDAIYLPSKYPLGSVLPEFVADEAICRQCLAIAERVQEVVSRILKAT